MLLSNPLEDISQTDAKTLLLSGCKHSYFLFFLGESLNRLVIPDAFMFTQHTWVLAIGRCL